MTELLPCPFCGAEAEAKAIRDGARVRCRKCWSSGPLTYHGPGRADNLSDTVNRAAAAWNTRALKPAQEAADDVISEIESMWNPDMQELHDALSRLRAALALARGETPA